MKSILKKPSAWLPIAMSAAALVLLLSYVAIFGTTQQPQADEGPAARLFQLLFAAQVPIIAIFTLKWFPRMPRQALQVLAMQIVAALIPIALVIFFES